MLAGTFAMNAYHLWTRGSCRDSEPGLAARSRFPIVMLLGCVAGGLGSAVTILASHAIGRATTPPRQIVTRHGVDRDGLGNHVRGRIPGT